MPAFAWQTRDEGAPIESDLTAVVNRKWLIANGRALEPMRDAARPSDVWEAFAGPVGEIVHDVIARQRHDPARRALEGGEREWEFQDQDQPGFTGSFSVLRKQLLVRSLLAEPALVKHEDLVGVLDRAEPVRDDDCGPAGKQAVEGLADHQLRLGVDARCSLVEYEELWIVR